MPMEAKVIRLEIFRLRLELDDHQPKSRLKPTTEAHLLKETQNDPVVAKLGNVITRGGLRQGTSRSLSTTILELQG